MLVFVDCMGTYLEFYRCYVAGWTGVCKLCVFPEGSNKGVVDSRGLNMGVVGYLRLVEYRSGNRVVVSRGGVYSDKEFGPRGQGYECG